MTPLTIAVDVDETVADLLTPWLQRYNHEVRQHLRGEELESYTELLPEDLTEWSMANAVHPEWKDRIYDLVTLGIYRDVRPILGARTAINVLRRLGHRVLFVTSCINGTADAKLDWLVRFGFLPKSRFQPDYLAVSEKALVRADVLLDDHVKNVEAFPGKAWLIDQPHNRSAVTRIPRLRGIAEAPEAITKWMEPYRAVAA